MSRTPKGMLIALALLSTAALMACQPQHPPQAQLEAASTAREASNMRTVVPLVRSLSPAATGPVELEFDVPAQPDDPAPPIFVGVRLTGSDPTETARAADALVLAHVTAEIRLSPVEDGGQGQVELRRSARDGEKFMSIPLGKDGVAPGLFAFNSDFTTMQAAGLLSTGMVYDELAFAYVPSLPAGRYRAVIRIGGDVQALLDRKAELVIAYTHKGK